MFIILDQDKEAVLGLRRRLYHHYTHTTIIAPTALAEITHYPAQGVLIPRPECLADPQATCRAIRELSPSLPIGMIYGVDNGQYFQYRRLVDVVFEARTTAGKICKIIYDIFGQRNQETSSSRIVDCLRVDRAVPGCVFLLGYGFPATREQWMLARYLVLAAPRAVPVAELLDTCFLPGRVRSARSVSQQLGQLDHMFSVGCGVRVFERHRPATYFIHERLSK